METTKKEFKPIELAELRESQMKEIEIGGRRYTAENADASVYAISWAHSKTIRMIISIEDKRSYVKFGDLQELVYCPIKETFFGCAPMDEDFLKKNAYALLAMQYASENPKLFSSLEDGKVEQFAAEMKRDFDANPRNFRFSYNVAGFARESRNIQPKETDIKSGDEPSSLSEEIEQIMSGKYFVDWKDWTPEEKAMIPSISILESVVIDDDTIFEIKAGFKHLKAIHSRELNPEYSFENVLGKDIRYLDRLYVGDPGTGKTTRIRILAAAWHMPLFSFICDENTEASILTGEITLKEGTYGKIRTELAKAIDRGYVIDVEEFNLLNANISKSIFTPLLERPYSFREFDKYDVKRNTSCVILASMNPNTAGSKPVATSILNRFMVEELAAPKKEDFIKRLALSYDNPAACKWVYEGYERICKYLKSDEASAEYLCEAISLRTCCDALQLIEDGMAPKKAMNVFRSVISAATSDNTIKYGVSEVISTLRRPDWKEE